MKKNIYADNAATTKLDRNAFEAMVPWLTDEFSNASQPYSITRKPKKALAEARETIARSINALPEEIFFTSGGTESDNWAIKGSAFSDFDKRTTITSSIEHHAVLNSCKAIELLGYPVVYLPPNKFGVVTPDLLEEHISVDTRLVSIMFSNNEIGTIEPIKELAAVAHKYGALFHTDAVQAVGHVKIDVKDLGMDMLSGSAHKFNGPKGVGFLYVRKGVSIVPFNDGGSQERGLRAGTENIASIVGMATALRINFEQMDTNKQYIETLEQELLSGIRKLDYVLNSAKHHVPGNISLSFKNADGETILHRMDLMGICISTGAACDGKKEQVSHVIKAIGVPQEYAAGTIRISLSKDNTIEEVKCIAAALVKILKDK